MAPALRAASFPNPLDPDLSAEEWTAVLVEIKATHHDRRPVPDLSNRERIVSTASLLCAALGRAGTYTTGAAVEDFTGIIADCQPLHHFPSSKLIEEMEAALRRPLTLHDGKMGTALALGRIEMAKIWLDYASVLMSSHTYFSSKARHNLQYSGRTSSGDLAEISGVFELRCRQLIITTHAVLLLGTFIHLPTFEWLAYERVKAFVETPLPGYLTDVTPSTIPQTITYRTVNEAQAGMEDITRLQFNLGLEREMHSISHHATAFHGQLTHRRAIIYNQRFDGSRVKLSNY